MKWFDKEEVYKHTRLIGLDYGFKNDPTALIVSYLDEENETLYIADEHYQYGMTTKEIAAMIRRKGYGKSLIIAESAEPRLNHELKNDYKLKIRTCTKKKDSINKDLIDLHSLKIVVHPECLNMIEEFYTYSYKFDKISGEYTNVPEDANNHLCDALRYSLQVLDRNKVKAFREAL